MGPAPAKIRRKGLHDFIIGGSRVRIHERFGPHDEAVDAIPALCRMIFKESFLDRMHFRDAAKAFECCDFRVLDRTHRKDARTPGAAGHDYRARSALAQAASEFRAIQIEVVAQDVK